MSERKLNKWISTMALSCHQYAPLQFIRQLEKHLTESGDHSLNTLRFTVNPALCFAKQEINRLSYDPSKQQIICQVNFMGLIGAAGVLPPHYHEQILNSKKSSALKAFLDIFHHRSITLFYQAWKKHQFTIDYEIGQAKIAMGSKVQVMLQALLGDSRAFASEKLPYLASFAAKNKSLSNLQSILYHTLQRAIVITPFRYATETLDQHHITRLTTTSTQMSNRCYLGTTMTLGETIRMDQSNVTVSIAANDYEDFKSLTADSSLKNRVHELCTYFICHSFKFSIVITLAPKHRHDMHLHQHPSLANRLGVDSWILPQRTIK